MEARTENVFDYIPEQENLFKTQGVPVIDGWDFEMYRHIRLTVLYKYGQLDTGKTDDKPVENIILPILNVAYRLEDLNVKDIELYVDSKKDYHLSFLARKFHDKWAEEFEMDTFLDEAKTEWVDFGLTLVKDDGRNPRTVPLQTLAFCDQTDILNGPICEKHQFSPDQLLEMKGRWNDEAVDEAIMMSRKEKANTQVQGQNQKTPGQYIEVYELHGMFPGDWIDGGDEEEYTRQIHIVTYYTGENNERKGISLYKGPERTSPYDACKRDSVFGRACGYGGAEELFESQVWHTYSLIQMKEMLDVAALMLVKSTDPKLKNKRITDMEKGEIIDIQEGRDAAPLVFPPINWEVFDAWQKDRKVAAQTQGSANDPQLGVEPKSGTAMGLQQITIAQGQGIHQYRRGLFATFIGRLYKNWFLKYLEREIRKGEEWMDELDLKELQWLADKVSKNESEKLKKKMILSGEPVYQVDIDDYKERLKKEILGSDRNKFLKIVKDEFKGIPIKVKVNVAGKQKDLYLLTEKIVSFMRAIIGTKGEILRIPGMSDLLNQVIEYSGLNPVDFSGLKPQEELPATQAAPPQELNIPNQPGNQPAMAQ